MTWIDLLWPMVTGACLTLALINLRIAFVEKPRAARLLFSFSAFSVAFISVMELALMHAESPARYEALYSWGDTATWAAISSLSALVWVFFGTGNKWLALAGSGAYGSTLLFYLGPGSGPTYLKITGLKTMETYGGATYRVAEGVPNPWGLLQYIGVLLMLIFTVDASVRLWRRGNPRRAAIVGGGLVFFILASLAHCALVDRGLVQTPYLISWFYLAILIAMGHELTKDVFAATALSRQLRESEERMTLAVAAANIGIWIRDLARNDIWASEKWRELFGFASSERLESEDVLQRIHPEDRAAVRRAFEKAVRDGSGYEMEHRVLLPDGRLRWISSRGRAEFDDKGQPAVVRGASRDCTARKLAEEAAHNLSGRLIQAQEQAQVRLARELHDDLSQSLALLSVELEMFGQNPPADAQKTAARMEEFSTQVKGLSSEVHQLSHHLHPAKLDQLGLTAAVRGFCKEFALAHEMAIEFTERDVPQTVPGDAALCLYRVAQEALHNVVKHSGATAAKVELSRENGQLRLIVADDGAGFDALIARTNGSLGLISMGERARFVGGRLFIESRPGSGTQVEVCVPIHAAEESASL